MILIARQIWWWPNIKEEYQLFTEGGGPAHIKQGPTLRRTIGRGLVYLEESHN